tara:strand:- start:242 stop:424 length:183 start_codon:yes stop_codon:yes gene_type:complete
LYNFLSLLVAVESGLMGGCGKTGFMGSSLRDKIKLGTSTLSSSNLFCAFAYFLMLLSALF